MLAAVQVGRDAGDVVQEALSTCWPCGGVLHLGVPLHADEARAAGFSKAATGAPAVVAGDLEARRGPR